MFTAGRMGRGLGFISIPVLIALLILSLTAQPKGWSNHGFDGPKTWDEPYQEDCDHDDGNEECIKIGPDRGYQGQRNLAVTIAGKQTDFIRGETIVDFGVGISVVSLDVKSPTSVVAILDIALTADLGFRTVIVATDKRVVKLEKGFRVRALKPSLALLNPATGQQVEQNLSVQITGRNTQFVQGATTADFGPGIKVVSVTVKSPTNALAVIDIAASAALGTRDVIVRTRLDKGGESRFHRDDDDKYDKDDEETVRLEDGFTVTPRTPVLFSVIPSSGQQGQNLSVVVTCQYTHFVQGKTTANFGAGISVASLAVNSSSVLTAVLNIGLAAPIGIRTVVITTGTEVCSRGAFTVTSGAPTLTAIIPNSGQQGQQNLSIALSGQNTHWAQGTTANFGAGITVVSVTVNSPTSATAVINVDAAAAIGPRTVTVVTNSETASFANGFSVTAGTPVLISVLPATGLQGIQGLTVSLSGQFTHFAPGTTSASFGAGITVLTTTVSSATSATALINIDPAASAGARTATVTTGSETASAVNGFTVVLPTPVVSSVSPNSGLQGQKDLSVVIAGQYTHFSQGNTTVSIGAGISVSSVTVSSPTSATALLDIDPGAQVGGRNVTVMTGAEVAPLNGGFTVMIGAPSLLKVDPNTGAQGQQSLSVALTGDFTHWLQTTSTANFGAGITVASLTVNSPTRATALVNIGGEPAVVLPTTTHGQAASGYAASDFATGFGNNGSIGPIGVAFDSPGNLFVMDFATGFLYKFGPGGGGASAATQVNAAAIGGTPSALAFAKDGSLYLTRQSANDVVQLDPTTGSILRTVAGVTYATGLAVDPLSGDLFASTSPAGNVVRISNFTNGPGIATNYASTGPLDGIYFGPDGTLYAALWSGGIASIAGTNSPTPGTVKVLPVTVPSIDGLAISADPSAPFIFGNRNDGIITKVDLTVTPPALTNIFSGGSRGDFTAVGPDGCLYATQTDRVLKVTNADGTCLPPPLGPLAPSSPGSIVAALGPRTVTVTTNAEVVSLANGFSVIASPIIARVNPGGGLQGQQNLSITIAGLNTHWVQGSTIATFGAGIAVVSLAVTSPTSATAVVSIDAAAAIGSRDVVLTTGTEIATLSNGFSVIGEPRLISVIPNTSQLGQQNLSIAITGQNTNFVQGTTTASFGTGVAIVSVNVTSPTSATAIVNIAATAAIGQRDATLTTNGEVATLASAFTVEPHSLTVNAGPDQYIPVSLPLGPGGGYDVVPLGTLGGQTSDAWGINDVGEVIGMAQNTGGVLRPFLWRTGQIFDLGTLGGLSGEATGINAAAQIVGENQNSSGQWRVVRYSEGKIEDLVAAVHPGGPYLEGINNHGDVVGVNYGSGSLLPFLYTNGTVTTLPFLSGGTAAGPQSINDNGTVVGTAYPSGGNGSGYAAAWMNGGVTELAELTGYPNGDPYQVNNLFQAVGYAAAPGQSDRAALWQNGTVVDLGTLGGSTASAISINDYGQIVGGAATASGIFHAALWSGGQALDLNNVVMPNPNFDSIVTARGINNRGQIVGSGSLGGVTKAFLLNPKSLSTTPPTTVPLAGNITDIGLAPGLVLQSTWSKVSGPGSVTFADPAQPQTTATFTAPGAYVLRLSASDSLQASSADVRITIGVVP
jgi:probable HAF family extracellular repeat protein